jgi:hypothetical protein
MEDFLRIPTGVCMPYSDEHNKSYIHQKVAYRRIFQQKAGNRFNFRARVRIGSGTELK